MTSGKGSLMGVVTSATGSPFRTARNSREVMPTSICESRGEFKTESRNALALGVEVSTLIILRLFSRFTETSETVTCSIPAACARRAASGRNSDGSVALTSCILIELRRSHRHANVHYQFDHE